MTKRVLILNDGADTGGGGIKIKRAFDKFAPDWEVRAVRRSNNYIDYPVDIEWAPPKPVPAEVLDLFRRADVVHLMNGERLSRHFPGYAEKPKILHIRGRGNGAKIVSAQSRGIPVYASTPNLITSGMEWLPNMGDATSLALLRKMEYRPPTQRHPRPPILVHAPTIRRLKGTERLLTELRPLATDGLLLVNVIEGLTLNECLHRKARGDLLFDQFAVPGIDGAYGSNAIEAWGLGMPVLNGEPTEPLAAWYEETMGFLPFVPVREDTVAGAVGALLSDPAQMNDARDKGREAFDRFHEESRVVAQLINAYEAVLG